MSISLTTSLQLVSVWDIFSFRDAGIVIVVITSLSFPFDMRLISVLLGFNHHRGRDVPCEFSSADPKVIATNEESAGPVRFEPE